MTNPDFTRPAATKNTEDTMPNTPAPAEKPKPYRPGNFRLTENTDASKSLPSINRGLPKRFRNIGRLLNTYNLDAPKELLVGLIATLTEAKKHVDSLVAEIHGQGLDAAAHAVLNGENPEEHLMRFVAWNQTIGGLQQRVEALARENFLQLVNDNADNLTHQIGEKLFFPTLAELTALIEEHPGKQWNLDVAVSSKDFAHAALIESNAHIAMKLHDACQLRALLYTHDAFTDEAAYMAEPGFKGAIATDSLQWWATVLDQGLTIWFPTANSWHKATHSEEFTEHRKAEAEALAELNAEAEAELGADKPAPFEPARYDSRSAY
ncbi:hypothetical protein ACTXM3_15710 [Glutamicibacter arilaitensis]|uniref:Uncharacterized protein n=1 Tax=Glutamicibacter arilaitensis TaxID=256701 RepID=A0A2N7RZQ0_9MICC|nr:hypothetical protein [Glutamicibacter arilaitensis]PMQ19348.1 hypothetical protein CIK84_11650 [Glutamicibacter arilaitensis]